MSCNNRSRPEETSVISLSEERAPVLCNSKRMTSSVSIILFKCMCWIGLIKESNRHLSHRVAALTIKMILILVNLEMWISSVVTFRFSDWKFTFFFLAPHLLTSVIYFAVYFKRNLIKITIHKLDELSESFNTIVINLITIVVCCTLMVLLTFQIIQFHHGHWDIAYIINLPYDITGMLLICTKSMFGFLVYPTLIYLVSLLYCVLCQSCCYQINNLTKEISQVSPEEFDPIQQMDVLRQKARIDDVLKNVQAIFSVPSFFIIAVNVLKCGSLLEIFTGNTWENSSLFRNMEVVLYSLTSFCCLFIVSWVAGGLPIQMKQLKKEFNEKVRSRLLCTRNLGEIQPKNNLFGQSDFAFTGCNIIIFNRNIILKISAFLIIYAFLPSPERI
ncbi:uncharacterized protein NPIL_173921 [Nephila pilipes]|uniref:Uncharacterized protein n=1 Tax=Nephila pilipes TaxID=299642 RepID=A0A8X6QPY2_NEPPI|nr:uncharacterized protein NPIL_173921 [Nephila pilipes]